MFIRTIGIAKDRTKIFTSVDYCRTSRTCDVLLHFITSDSLLMYNVGPQFI